MSSGDALGPFQPGPGAMPPYLAGREAEQSLFRTLLARLQKRSPLPSEILLYGPRGNGKTVLLRWLEAEAASFDVQVMVLFPSEIPDERRLGELLRPDAWWHRVVPGQLGVAGVSWGSHAHSLALSPTSSILARRASKQPLLLVLDEAHTLDLSVGRILLNACQWVRERSPFLVVLAGTPNIEGHLSRMGASFWNRARQIRVGRLDDRATRDAFWKPFVAEGVSVEATVLSEIVRLSHGYPYFIQLLGEAVWGVACVPDGPRRITPSVLTTALPAFEATRGHYYRHRYLELRERRLLDVARSVAAAFSGRDRLADAELTAAIRSGLEDPSHEKAIRAERTLLDLGFIWGTTPEPAWEPGIPSLMDYIVEQISAP